MFAAKNLVLAAVLLAAAAAWPQQGGDLQAQILYAYQTEDGNNLTNLIQDLTTQVKSDAGAGSLKYHLAHAQYRRALLAGSKNTHLAEASLSASIDQPNPLLPKDEKPAGGMTLRGACYGTLGSHKKLES